MTEEYMVDLVVEKAGQFVIAAPADEGGRENEK
jgi:hypothetical protein